nr:MAG TPA: hypothetical protein [Caudoviricetes sp.]
MLRLLYDFWLFCALRFSTAGVKIILEDQATFV